MHGLASLKVESTPDSQVSYSIVDDLSLCSREQLYEPELN